MNELFLKVGQLKTDIESSINNIYETPQKSSKFDNINAINAEIVNLQQKTEGIKQMITRMNSDVSSLKSMVNVSTKVESTTIWRKKISNFESESHNLTMFLQRAYNFRMDKIKAEKEQFELFNGARTKKSDTENEAVKIQINTRDSLQRANQRAAEIVELGTGTLGSLARQNESLKNVQKRMLSFLNELGISNNFIRLIQKRSRTDLLIFCGLAIFLILFIVVLIVWVKPYLRG